MANQITKIETGEGTQIGDSFLAKRKHREKDEGPFQSSEQIIHQLADLRIMRVQIDVLEKCLEARVINISAQVPDEPELRKFMTTISQRFRRKAASFSERVRKTTKR